MDPGQPFLSVVMPARQAASLLPHSLAALAESDLPRSFWELIVVDDASTDSTSVVAAAHADTVIRLPGKPHGPAYARNRGVEASRGEIIVFVDADVCVHPDALRRFAVLFAKQQDLGAAFGSYDTRPPAPGLISRYRNLLHAYVHHRDAGEAETFWAGCGAVRASVLADVGGFDEWHYSQPQIEDIELGRRLRKHGHRILLRPEIQGTHLKRWTLRDVLRTDFHQRGVPWMWLILQEGQATQTLNIKTRERWLTGAAGLSAAGVVAAAVLNVSWPLGIAAAAAAFVLLFSLGFYRFLWRHVGPGFAIAVVPLHYMYYLLNVVAAPWGWLMRALFGEPQPPPDVEAQAALGIRTWPPGPERPARSLWSPRAAVAPEDPPSS